MRPYTANLFYASFGTKDVGNGVRYRWLTIWLPFTWRRIGVIFSYLREDGGFKAQPFKNVTWAQFAGERKAAARDAWKRTRETWYAWKYEKHNSDESD
jgi:hypothetical protein